MKSIRIIGYATDELRDFMNEWDSDSPGITAHTSGSTGVPKNILLSRDDMLMSARATCRYFGIDAGSILGLPLSASYIAGKMMAMRSLVSGASLYIETPSNRPLESYTGLPVSLLSVVPSQLRYLLDSGRLSLVQRLLIGGSPLPETLESALLAAGYHSAYVSYGMTETCSHVALRRIGSDVYEALPGTEFALDDRGCLIIVTYGASYSPTITNDIAELIDPIHFRWLGRF
ncbi:MAG: AMP-binding protein, partial [Paramuribaculum sp.]|nr:AMP-binding protein [Paramuribaculum sp.]